MVRCLCEPCLFGSLFYHCKLWTLSLSDFIFLTHIQRLRESSLVTFLATEGQICQSQYFLSFTRLCGKALKLQKNSVEFSSNFENQCSQTVMFIFLHPRQWLASELWEPFIVYIDLFMGFLRQKIIKRCIHLLTRNTNKSFWISLKESWAFRLTKHKKGKLTC